MNLMPWLVIVATLLLASGARAAGAEDSGGARKYVGGGACAPCHRAAYDSWKGSHHDLAMAHASAGTVLGDFTNVKVTFHGISSTFYRRSDRYFVQTDGPDGRLHDYEIQYTFGWFPLQQYLVAFAGGRLQALSIAWDSRPKEQGGQRWFHLYPGERISSQDELHWTGPQQNWNYVCAACHSTNLKKNYDATTNRYASTWSDVNVACEACHGPGSRHVEWAQAQARTRAHTPASSRTPSSDGDNGLVVQFQKEPNAQWGFEPLASIASRRTGWSRPEEIQVCAPCHSRRSVIDDGYVAGQPLLDSYIPALLTEPLYHADGQIRAEVYEYGSFLQSRMYERGVSCTNCHDPHSLKLRAPGNAVCAQCHLAAKYDSRLHHFHEPGSASARCVACHMPTTTYMVVHARHDHSVRVPRPDLSVALGTPNACNQCHTKHDAGWAAAQVRKWYGHDARGYQTYARMLHAARTAAAEAEELLTSLAGNTGQPAIARATALSLLPSDLSPASLRAVQLGLSDDDPLLRCAAIGALEAVPSGQRLPLAAPLLADPVRAVRIEAARQLATTSTDELSTELRAQIERGIDEYVAAQRVDADRPESHTNLGVLYAERARYEDAEMEFRSALKLQPAYVPAWADLADLRRAQGRDRDAESLLRQGLERAPKDASLHHARGLALVRLRQTNAAVQELARAAVLAPDEARFAYVYAVALHSTGRQREAIEAIEQALARHPTNREMLAAAATFSRDAGDRAAALKYAARLVALAPSDSAAQQLLQELRAPTPAEQ